MSGKKDSSHKRSVSNIELNESTKIPVQKRSLNLNAPKFELN